MVRQHPGHIGGKESRLGGLQMDILHPPKIQQERQVLYGTPVQLLTADAGPDIPSAASGLLAPAANHLYFP